MPPEQRLDLLIESGRKALESGCDEQNVKQWRKMAYECVVDLLGEDHAYSEHFRFRCNEMDESYLLTGVGVLTAAALGYSQHKAMSRRNGDYTVSDMIRCLETFHSEDVNSKTVISLDPADGDISKRFCHRRVVR